ncbi:MAG: hypothetical protein V1793_12225 [Pseudomonadota bacterium]
MEVSLPVVIYASLSVLYCLALAAGLFGKKGAAKGLGIAGFWFCAASVAAFIIQEKRLPLFGPFESILMIIFCLGGLGLLSRGLPGSRTAYAMDLWTFVVILVLLGIQTQFPMAFNPDFYMYDNLWVNLFFHLRLVATGTFIHAAILVALGAWIKGRTQDPSAENILHRGRNYLLTGIALFLTSEWSGSLWCLNWLGDSWQWSRGFFRGSVVFLLVMTACHLPRSLYASMAVRSVACSLPGLFCLWMIFFH